MNVNITSRKFKAKDSLKDFIKDELKSLEKYNDDILEANVVLSFLHPKDSLKTTEITLKIPGKILTASDSSEGFEKSVTKAIEKLTIQIKKLKSKRLTRVR